MISEEWLKWDKLSESEKVISIIQACGLQALGNWDGCCCSHFNLRGVDVEIGCGKGGEQAVWVSSKSMDHSDETLTPIMAEVIRQVSEQSNRSAPFAQHIGARREQDA